MANFTILQIAAGVALAGFWFHELIRVPALFGLTPDGFLIDLVVTVGLLAAVLKVLPLSWLPFRPEQTATHYVAHLVFGLCQLPLLALALTGALAHPRKLPVPSRR